MEKERRRAVRLISVIIPGFLLIAAAIAFKLYGDYLEIAEIGSGFVAPFIKNTVTKITVYLVSLILVFTVIYIQITAVNRQLIKCNVRQTFFEKKSAVAAICSVISVFVSFFLNKELSSNFLMLKNYIPFNVKDPIFSKDIGYYVFTRPFLLTVFDSFFAMWTAVTAVVVLVYFFSYFKVGERTLVDMAKCKPIVNHIAFNVIVYMVGKALFVSVESKDLLFSEFSGYLGAGFADVNVWLNYYNALPYIMLIITALVIYFLKKNMIKPAAITFASYFAVYICVWLISGVINTVYVSPNESKVEERYISNNIEYTKRAYKIDSVRESDYKIKNVFSSEETDGMRKSAEKIKTLDTESAISATNQLQGLRNYYIFRDLDVGVYNISGENSLYFIGAREINTDNLEESANNYVNEKYRYTHGYGIVMAPVNKVNQNGEPEYLIKDTSNSREGITPVISQPRIYFGEGNMGDAVVNTKIGEYDYSQGDKDFEFNYDGGAGINLTFINRAVMAIKTGDMKLLVSGQLNEDSRLLLNRNIIERISKAAPFLKIDTDPQAVVTDTGRIIWVADGYTVTDQYPYSQRYEDFNYIRNSVKVTVDAYDGTVKIYVIDRADPIINVYYKMFPTMFEQENIPDDIMGKTKYPMWLFSVQSSMFSKYHTDSVSAFYNKSDMYSVANEKYNGEVTPVKPYYNLLRMDEYNKNSDELVLMLPYTMYNRENMVAYLTVGNSKENYGKMVCYKLPKNYNIYGPLQVENMIDNDSAISKELSVLESGGSSVTRGELTIVPINGGILYIEPVYISSKNKASFPSLKKIIAVFGNKTAIEDNIDLALDKVFSGDNSDVFEVSSENDNSDSAELKEIKEKIAKAYDEIQRAAKDGDWNSFGNGMDSLKDLVEGFGNETSDNSGENKNSLQTP